MKIKLIILSFCMTFFFVDDECNSQSGWFKLFPDTTNYFTALYFISAETGFIGSSAGTIQKTTNGGLEWSQQNSGSNQWIHSIYFLNPTTGFYVGTYGIIFKTINGGSNWNSIDSLNTELFSIRFANSNIGFTVGHQGAIFKTANGGSTWLLQNSNTTDDLFSIYQTDLNTAYVVGLNGQILKTINGGNDWIFQNSNVSNLLRSVYFTNSFTGYVVGGNKILKTSNSGLNWNTQYTGNQLNNIFFADANIGYTVGYNGEILKTINGGINWYPQVSGTSSVLTNIHFSNMDTGYLVGGEFENFGIILKTTNGGEPIGIQPISNEIPNSFKLFQNFPNPFNPTTKIKFSIPAPSPLERAGVRLNIYDILGRVVAILVNEKLQPGTYEVEWDGSNYSSGVYYYKLIAGNYTETKKMILIK